MQITKEQKAVYLILLGWKVACNIVPVIFESNADVWYPPDEIRTGSNFLPLSRIILEGRPMPWYYTLDKAYDLQRLLNE